MIKNFLGFSFLFACLAFGAAAVEFDKTFQDSTLFFDVTIVTKGENRMINVDWMHKSPKWYGRRVNLAKPQYPETLDILLTDSQSGDTIYGDVRYMNLGYSEDSVKTTVRVPVPRRNAELRLTGHYFNERGKKAKMSASFGLEADMLKSLPTYVPPRDVPYFPLRAAKTANPINLAFVSEGYTAEELPRFLKECQKLDSALFADNAFSEYADRFNVVAIGVKSLQSGISTPEKGVKVNTAFGAEFDKAPLQRLLLIPEDWRIWHAIEGLPADYVIVLANSEDYGGSGSYAGYCVSTTGHPWWLEVTIHEFGHYFGNLGDEYEAEGTANYSSKFEPTEPNITTRADFSGKWQNLIDSGEASLIEGAGYQSKGVWRGCEHCLMREVSDRTFCPVCAQALKRTINFLTTPE